VKVNPPYQLVGKKALIPHHICHRFFVKLSGNSIEGSAAPATHRLKEKAATEIGRRRRWSGEPEEALGAESRAGDAQTQGEGGDGNTEGEDFSRSLK
jgi:hypothetical protein